MRERLSSYEENCPHMIVFFVWKKPFLCGGSL
jgi:hypothetical protein